MWMSSSPDRCAWTIDEGYLRSKAGKQPVGRPSPWFLLQFSPEFFPDSPHLMVSMAWRYMVK